MAKGIVVNYQGNKITTTIYEQQIWFLYEDVEKIIDTEGFTLYFEESAKINVDDKLLSMINEFGVYRLLCSLNTNEAKDFRKWLIYDAIYRLRKYGYYKLSILEQKEKIIGEIIELRGNDSDADKLKFFSLDKLKLEKALLLNELERNKKEKEIAKKRTEVTKDFPYARTDFENDYDISMAVKNLSWCKENLDEYMVWINDNECYLSEKFIQYLKDGDYQW